jgi:hypothetical protein
MPLLTKDYIRIKKMFTEFEEICKKGNAEGKETLAIQICQALTARAQMEEKIFYAVVREAIYDDVLMNEAMIEPATAKDLIAQIQSMRVSGHMYDVVIAVLSEYINHSVTENKNEIFSGKESEATVSPSPSFTCQAA